MNTNRATTVEFRAFGLLAAYRSFKMYYQNEYLVIEAEGHTYYAGNWMSLEEACIEAYLLIESNIRAARLLAQQGPTK